jgi:site-specific DNA recombinase
LYKLLNNEIYTGRIAHKGESYLGQHPAIIDPVTWEKVQVLLAHNNRGQRQQGRKASSSVLAGYRRSFSNRPNASRTSQLGSASGSN